MPARRFVTRSASFSLPNPSTCDLAVTAGGELAPNPRSRIVQRHASHPIIERPFLLVLAGLLLIGAHQVDAGLRTPSASVIHLNEAPVALAPEPLFHIDIERPATARFDWPAVGPISSHFGPEHPLGVDIGLALFPASPILATAPGVVSFAGGVACCGYGFHVLVDHGDGLTSLYAHLSEIEVAEGQAVRQGDRLGISGNTGFSTSEHLHFEIRQHDAFLDPLLHLRSDAPLN
jgi:murein DD-endopeptidase MepM/ murein hydrolase activator NlpD